jgi:hypothetical protein
LIEQIAAGLRVRGGGGLRRRGHLRAGLGVGPAPHLRGGVRKSARFFKPPPLLSERLKQLHIFEQAVGVKVFQLAKPDREAGAVVIGDREAQLDRELRHHVVEIVPVDFDRRAPGEPRPPRGARAVGSACEIS